MKAPNWHIDRLIGQVDLLANRRISVYTGRNIGIVAILLTAVVLVAPNFNMSSLLSNLDLSSPHGVLSIVVLN